MSSPESPSPADAPNAVQRHLLAWADAGRRDWPPERRAQAQLLDRHLVGSAGLGMGTGILAGCVGMSFSLRSAGASWGWALLLAGAFLLTVVLGARHAWLRPERFAARRLLRIGALMVLATYASTLALTWRRTRGADAAWPAAHEWPGLLWQATPLQLSLGLAGLFMVWLVGMTRRRLLEEELARLKLRQERDTAARAATEARLSLLQAQIQPHFIFNTLAALQHWVDTGDARAPGLLRALTGFLRASTELLSRERVSLGEEAAMVGQYLTIQQARLGERLHSQISLPAALQDRLIPPGLLLTVVENALEHGISPALGGGDLLVHGQVTPEGGWLWVDNSGQALAPQAAPRAPELALGGAAASTAADAKAQADAPATAAAAAGTGVGLRNCRERLLRQLGAQARLELFSLPDGRTRAQVWLPHPPHDAAPLKEWA